MKKFFAFSAMICILALGLLTALPIPVRANGSEAPYPIYVLEDPDYNVYTNPWWSGHNKTARRETIYNFLSQKYTNVYYCNASELQTIMDSKIPIILIQPECTPDFFFDPDGDGNVIEHSTTNHSILYDWMHETGSIVFQFPCDGMPGSIINYGNNGSTVDGMTGLKYDATKNEGVDPTMATFGGIPLACGMGWNHADKNTTVAAALNMPGPTCDESGVLMRSPGGWWQLRVATTGIPTYGYLQQGGQEFIMYHYVSKERQPAMGETEVWMVTGFIRVGKGGYAFMDELTHYTGEYGWYYGPIMHLYEAEDIWKIIEHAPWSVNIDSVETFRTEDKVLIRATVTAPLWTYEADPFWDPDLRNQTDKLLISVKSGETIVDQAEMEYMRIVSSTALTTTYLYEWNWTIPEGARGTYTVDVNATYPAFNNAPVRTLDTAQTTVFIPPPGIYTLTVKTQWSNGTAIEGAAAALSNETYTYTESTSTLGIAVFIVEEGAYNLTVTHAGVTLLSTPVYLEEDTTVTLTKDSEPYAQIEDLEDDVTTLEGQVTTLEGQVTTLEGQVDALEADLESARTTANTNLYGGLGGGVVVGLIIGIAVMYVIKRRS